MSSFRDEVYTIVTQIPRGKVTTYGYIASATSSPKAARAVGQLMKRNQRPDLIPCHRVVGAQGRLTGYAFNGVVAKRKKLLEEGVCFKGDRADMTLSLWKPMHPTDTEYK